MNIHLKHQESKIFFFFRDIKTNYWWEQRNRGRYPPQTKEKQKQNPIIMSILGAKCIDLIKSKRDCNSQVFSYCSSSRKVEIARNIGYQRNRSTGQGADVEKKDNKGKEKTIKKCFLTRALKNSPTSNI